MTGWLAQTLVPIAWCWRIERRDGVTLGFTTHDAPLLIDHLPYRPAPGIRPSAIHQQGGIDGDSFEVEGALATGGISGDDLASGRWDDARLTLLVANWDSPGDEPLIIADGRIGPVSSDGRQFVAELSMHDPLLAEPIVPDTSAECRAELGDRRCRVDMATRTYRARIVAADANVLTMDRQWPDGVLGLGRMRWLTGPDCGLYVPIRAQQGANVTIEPMPGRPNPDAGAGLVGTIVALREGCDKRAATCTARFANIANFRGEPHVPGMDLLTRFPGGA